MKVTITNHGSAHARMLDLSVTTALIGLTQETDDGLRPYNERNALAPGESWDVEVPLITLRATFDHPFTIEDAALDRPTITLRWFEYYSRRMQSKRIVLDGDWLQHYAPYYETEIAVHRQEAQQVQTRVRTTLSGAWLAIRYRLLSLRYR